MKLDIVNFKKLLRDNGYVNLPIILVADDNNKFLLKTYIDKICQNTGLKKYYCDNLSEIDDLENNMFVEKNNIYIYSCQKDFTDFSRFSNVNAILLRNTDKGIESSSIDYVVLPKPSEANIEDYASTLAPGLSTESIKWLCSASKYDLDRLTNELDKITLFDEKEQQSILDQMVDENCYHDLSPMNIFDFSNYLMKKDYANMDKALQKIETVDIEGLGLVTLLLRQFRNLIDVKLSKNPSPENLKMSEKQINYLRYYMNSYSLEDIKRIYTFLTNIDSKLKNGYLDMNNTQFVTYIIGRVLQ